MNTYAYSSNNPVRWLDQFGLAVTGEIVDIGISDPSVNNFDWQPGLHEMEPGLWSYGHLYFDMSGTAQVKIRCTDDSECGKSSSWTLGVTVNATTRASIQPKEFMPLPPLANEVAVLLNAIYQAGDFAYHNKDILKAIARGLVNPTLICRGDIPGLLGN